MSVLPPNVARQAETVKVALGVAANLEKGSAGPCASCKHMAIRWVFCQGHKPCCTNPLVAVPTFDVVGHQVEQPVVSCAEARRGLCGAKGLFYESNFLGLSLTWQIAIGVLSAITAFVLVLWWL